MAISAVQPCSVLAPADFHSPSQVSSQTRPLSLKRPGRFADRESLGKTQVVQDLDDDIILQDYADNGLFASTFVTNLWINTIDFPYQTRPTSSSPCFGTCRHLQLQGCFFKSKSFSHLRCTGSVVAYLMPASMNRTLPLYFTVPVILFPFFLNWNLSGNTRCLQRLHTFVQLPA
jgi:hypothetical protein